MDIGIGTNQTASFRALDEAEFHQLSSIFMHTLYVPLQATRQFPHGHFTRSLQGIEQYPATTGKPREESFRRLEIQSFALIAIGREGGARR